jgi:hypothetical protein
MEMRRAQSHHFRYGAEGPPPLWQPGHQ